MGARAGQDGGGAPGAEGRVRAAFRAGDYLRAARLAVSEGGEDAQEVLRAMRPDPAAFACGGVLLAIIVGYWLVVGH
jgi:hypothetical protein